MKKLLFITLISIIACSTKIDASAAAAAAGKTGKEAAAAHSSSSSSSASAGSISSSASCAATASATPHGPLVVTAEAPERRAVWKFEKEASAAANLNDWFTADPENDIFANPRKMNVLMILAANQRSTQGNPFCHTKMGPNNLLVLVNASGMTEDEAADYQANLPKR